MADPHARVPDGAASSDSDGAMIGPRYETSDMPEGFRLKRAVTTANSESYPEDNAVAQDAPQVIAHRHPDKLVIDTLAICDPRSWRCDRLCDDSPFRCDNRRELELGSCGRQDPVHGRKHNCPRRPRPQPGIQHDADPLTLAGKPASPTPPRQLPLA